MQLLALLLTSPKAGGPAASAEAGCPDGPASLEAILARARALHKSTKTIGSDVRASLAVADGDDIDDAIALAESVEQTRAADHEALLQLADAGARLAPAPLRAVIAKINRATVAASADWLETVRDVRWELLARRAASGPAPTHAAPAGDVASYVDALFNN
jgi:hypothetical protein